MQSGVERRDQGRGGSPGGRSSRDGGDRGRGRGRGVSRGGGRGRGRSQAPATSLGVQKGGKLRSLKNQIRGVERLLRKEDIEPKARTKQTALLEQLKAATKQHDQSELERKYAVRYHKIRFFERVKLERQIKQLEKASSEMATENERQGTQHDLAKLRDDLQYVLHFPKGEKYVSIVKSAEEPAGAAALEKERSRLRALLARQLAEVAMVTEADEGASLQAAASAAAAAAGHAAVESDEDDFFLSDGVPDCADAGFDADANAGEDEIGPVETAQVECTVLPAAALTEPPPVKRQRAGKAVALRAAAKLGSRAGTGDALQTRMPSNAPEISGAFHNQEREYPAYTASVRAGPALHGAIAISSRAEQPISAGRTDSKPRGAANLRILKLSNTKAAGQQRAPAKSEWLPRGLAQQKQQQKFQNSKPALLGLSVPLAVAPSAVDTVRTRKRSQGGRKRRKKAE